MFIIETANSDVLILLVANQSWRWLGTISRFWEWLSWHWMSIMSISWRQPRKMLWIIIRRIWRPISISGIWSCRGAGRTAVWRGYSWLERVCTWKFICPLCWWFNNYMASTCVYMLSLLWSHWCRFRYWWWRYCFWWWSGWARCKWGRIILSTSNLISK